MKTNISPISVQQVCMGKPRTCPVSQIHMSSLVGSTLILQQHHEKHLGSKLTIFVYLSL